MRSGGLHHSYKVELVGFDSHFPYHFEVIMKRIVLESPFAGNVELNVAYAKLCVRDILLRDEAPIASHLLFTQPGLLDDTKPEQRKLGIAAGHAWIAVADEVVVYGDLGISKGMELGILNARKAEKPITYRYLPKEQIESLMVFCSKS